MRLKSGRQKGGKAALDNASSHNDLARTGPRDGLRTASQAQHASGIFTAQVWKSLGLECKVLDCPRNLFFPEVVNPIEAKSSSDISSDLHLTPHRTQRCTARVGASVSAAAQLLTPKGLKDRAAAEFGRRPSHSADWTEECSESAETGAQSETKSDWLESGMAKPSRSPCGANKLRVTFQVRKVRKRSHPGFDMAGYGPDGTADDFVDFDDSYFRNVPKRLRTGIRGPSQRSQYLQSLYDALPGIQDHMLHEQPWSRVGLESTAEQPDAGEAAVLMAVASTSNADCSSRDDVPQAGLPLEAAPGSADHVLERISATSSKCTGTDHSQGDGALACDDVWHDSHELPSTPDAVVGAVGASSGDEGSAEHCNDGCDVHAPHAVEASYLCHVPYSAGVQEIPGLEAGFALLMRRELGTVPSKQHWRDSDGHLVSKANSAAPVLGHSREPSPDSPSSPLSNTVFDVPHYDSSP